MRHVPMAAFKDNVARYIAQASEGEEIVVTRHGKAMARVVSAQNLDDQAAYEASIDEAFAFGQEILRTRGPTTAAEISAWIREDRRWED